MKGGHRSPRSERARLSDLRPPLAGVPAVPVTWFEVTVDDDGSAVRGSFLEVDGLPVELVPIEYRDGDQVRLLREVPGLNRSRRLVLRRGRFPDPHAYRQILEAMLARRRPVPWSVALITGSGVVVRRWIFDQAWPVRWDLAQFDASKNDLTIETLEVAHEGLSAPTEADPDHDVVPRAGRRTH